jgi:two-component system, cell cycle response regulator DivK
LSRFPVEYSPVTIRVLIVEDTAETRDILTILLERRGFEVIVAGNGYEGIKQALTYHPDLIITDITMPKFNGIDMIKILRSISDAEKIPMLAITAHGMEMAESAIKAGADRAMAHPIDESLLLAFIKELLTQDPLLN